MKTYSFEKLEVWQYARQLAVRMYQLTRTFPEDERFGIIAQMRRSSVSIASNIAEGTSRYSSKDQVRFYEIAYGSLMELLNQLIISGDLAMARGDDVEEIRNDIDMLSFKLSKLRESQLRRG